LQGGIFCRCTGPCCTGRPAEGSPQRARCAAPRCLRHPQSHSCWPRPQSTAAPPGNETREAATHDQLIHTGLPRNCYVHIQGRKETIREIEITNSIVSM